ncbi:MAG: DUF2914 domain-containing protein [Deltaproteobacteria bacterium]|nr:DUF2914 domain-containing protein [Deltaproteobacteria bacterium]
MAILGAVMMERTPNRARLVGGLAVAGFGLLWGMLLIRRRTEGSQRRVDKVARFVALGVAQSGIQQALYFATPFFALTGLSWFHAPFFVLLLLALAASTWDPWFSQIVERPWLLFALQGAGAWWSLVVVLPIMGLPLLWSHLTTALALALVAPWGAKSLGLPRPLLFSVAVPVVLIACAPILPPAPLSLAKIGIGTEIVERELVSAGARLDRPSSLYCQSSIRAPLGLRDRLFHTWRIDGRFVQRVEVEVSGGRAAGFRTWSRWSSPRQGVVSCLVETETHQRLGVASASVVR